MKKAFISILLFYYTLHFLLPGSYFLINGYFNLYAADVTDWPATWKGFALNSAMILGSILVIYFLPAPKRKLAPKYYDITKLLYFSILFSVFFFFMRGGFEGAITGNMGGSFTSYVNMFLKSNFVLMAILFYQKKKIRPGLLFFLFLIYTTLQGSRSGAISLFVVFLMYPVFQNYELYKKKLRRVLLVFLIASPVLFVLATVLVRKADVGVDSEMILNQIAGRMSFLETSMLPIHYKDNGELNLDLFYTKYSLGHQVQLMIDGLIPGSVFEFDVMPNQYYRALFLGYSEEYVMESYTSINLTLPVYLYMYFNEYITVIFSILIIVGYYLLCVKCYHKAIIFLPLLASLYHLLYYFDWVMWFMILFPGILTMLTITGYSITRKAIVAYLKVRTPEKTGEMAKNI